MNDPLDPDVDEALDLLLAAARPSPPVGALAQAAAMPARIRSTRLRRARWATGLAIAGVLTLGGTAAIAAPLLLRPFPGYRELAAFSYGVGPGRPGIRCETVIAVEATPEDPEYDPGIVERFSAYMRAQRYSIPVPAAAREPYPGGASSTSPGLYQWPGTEALNLSYSTVMGDVYARFDRTDHAGRSFGAQDPRNPLSHSVVIQDSVSCSGHP